MFCRHSRICTAQLSLAHRNPNTAKAGGGWSTQGQHPLGLQEWGPVHGGSVRDISIELVSPTYSKAKGFKRNSSKHAWHTRESLDTPMWLVILGKTLLRPTASSEWDLKFTNRGIHGHLRSPYTGSESCECRIRIQRNADKQPVKPKQNTTPITSRK